MSDPQAQQSHPAPEPDPAVRPAVLADADAICDLVAEAARSTSVLPRGRDNICQTVRDFMVLEHQGRIIGCGALSPFTPTLAEIRSLVIAPDWRGRGVGGRLVGALVAEAARLGVRRLFALTDGPAFFARCGFKPVEKSTLPHKVWNECIHCPKFLDCPEEAMEMLLPAVLSVDSSGSDRPPK